MVEGRVLYGVSAGSPGCWCPRQAPQAADAERVSGHCSRASDDEGVTVSGRIPVVAPRNCHCSGGFLEPGLTRICA